ncbi:MAG: PAS domain S-box protein [bacterium]
MSLKFVMAAAFCIILYCAFRSHRTFKEERIAQTQQQLRLLAHAEGRSLAEILYHVVHDMQILAQIPYLVNAQQQQKTVCEVKLHKKTPGYIFFENHKHIIDSFYRLDTEGICLGRRPIVKEYVGRDYSHEPGVDYVIKHHRPTIGFIKPDASGKALSVCVPVMALDEAENEHFMGILRAVIYLDSLNNHLNYIVSHLDDCGKPLYDDKDLLCKSHNHAWIRTSDGEVICDKHTEHIGLDYKEHIQGEQYTISDILLWEESRIKILNQEWYVGVGIAYKDIAGPINKNAANLLALLAFLFILCGGVGYGLYTTQKRKAVLEAEAENLKKIAAMENKFRSLVETTSDWIWEVNRKGVYTYANPKAKDIVGYEPDELIGKTPFDLMPADEAKRVGELFVTHAANKKPMNKLENIAIHKDGRLVILETSGVPILDDEGALVGYQGIDRDITERKVAEKVLRESEKRFRQFFNIEPNYCYMVSPEGVILDVNNTALKALGYMKKEIVGAPLTTIYAPESLPKMKTLFQKWHQTGYIKDEEMIIISKNGERRTVILSVASLRNENNEIVHSISVQRDITERKRHEDALQQALAKAEESDRLKSAFLANMSHEIRTPMNAIIGFTSLMLHDELSPEHIEYLHNVKESGDLLLALIDDILDLSKIDAGQLAIEQIPCSLHAIFKSAGSTCHMIIAHKGKNVSLRHSFPNTFSDSIITDPIRVQQILNNLLSNAVKFTEHGFIEYGVSLKDKDTLEFYVRDTGIGIPDDKAEAIFKPFQQSDGSHTRKYGGTGLGLTICKKLLTLMGGQITFTSQVGEGHGTTFYFTLPYKPTEHQETYEREMPEALEAKTGLTILVAEDDVLNQALARTILEREGYTVMVTNDGKETISLYKTDPSIDVILMDIQMPVLDGYEATRVIRTLEGQEKKKKRIPIIALTAFAMKGDREKCIDAGMDDYVSKPIKALELLACIQRETSKNDSL